MRHIESQRILALVGLVLGASLWLAVPSASFAQSGGAAQPAKEPLGLAEVVVTARKRVESAQDVPVALTAITAELVDRYDLTSLEKVAASTPQFNVGRASNGSGAQITLRGIGSQATSIGLEQSTAIVVDGVYYGQGRVINEAFLDLARVELLKGPQALYFGKNATAGVVNISTADPTNKWESMVRAGYEFQAQEPIVEGFMSGPITPTLSFRLTGRYSKMNGDLFHNIAQPSTLTTLDLATGALTPRVQKPSEGPFPGTDDRAVRATLRWEPIDRLVFTLKAGYNNTKDESNAGNYVPSVCAKADGTAQTNPLVKCAGNFNIHQPSAPAGFENGGVPGTRANGQPFNDYKSKTFTGTVNYNADRFSITSVTNYNWNRNLWGLGFNIESPTSFTTSTEDTTYWAFSNETRLQTSFDGPVNGMIGTYYQRSKRDYFQNGNFVALTDSSAPDPYKNLAYTKSSQTKGETISAFGQLSWQIVPKVELAAGARFTHETKKSFLQSPYIMSVLRGLFLQYDPNDPKTRINGDQKFENWSPEATLRFKPNSNMMIYGAYKTAYKSGGFSNSAFVVNGAPASNIAFDPEKAHGFEGGIKTTLLDRQLRLNVNAYSYTFDNLQVDFFDSISFQFITTNAGSATTKGIETEFEYAPNAVPGLDLHGSINYNRARYENYIAPCYGGQSIQAGCNTTFLGGFGQDLSGQPTAIAPKVTASLGGNYEIDIPNNLVLGFSADARYSGSYLGSSFGEPLSRNGSYVSVDASLRLRTQDNHWEVALLGRNLTDDFHISGILDAPNSGTGTGTANALPADILGLADNPRTVRLQFTWRP
jgi:outer membrane receptor protein involved in Fe transport